MGFDEIDSEFETSIKAQDETIAECRQEIAVVRKAISLCGDEPVLMAKYKNELNTLKRRLRDLEDIRKSIKNMKRTHWLGF